MLNEYYSNFDDAKSIPLRYLREVLLSYRIIFAQKSSSRKQFKSSEWARVKAASNTTPDPLLKVLCSEPKRSTEIRSLPSYLWSEQSRDAKDQLLEHDTYNSVVDFPMLGRRLLQLQELSLRQNPSRIRDLWRDRRNVVQWYTFWAVLIVAIMAFFAAVIQIALSIAQLIFTIKQVN